LRCSRSTWRRGDGRYQVQEVGPAGHHAPEDQPDAIGQSIAWWLIRHRLTARPGVMG
jgi:haloalkane dehalogenase